MSEGTDTRYFSQIQTVCHPVMEWHTTHIWATQPLVPAQNMPDFSRYESKLIDCTNCRAITYEQMFVRYKWTAMQLRQLHAVAHPSAMGMPQNARPIRPSPYPQGATARESALQNKRAASAMQSAR